jgi:hypothetical protein
MLSYAMKIGLIIVDNGITTGFFPTGVPESPTHDPTLVITRNYVTGVVTIDDSGRVVNRKIDTMLTTPVIINSRRLPGTNAQIKAVETFPGLKIRASR